MGIALDHVWIITATNEQNADVGTFFRDVLALEVDGDPADGYAEVRAGGQTIALHRGTPVEPLTPHGGTLLQFRSDDVSAFVEQARGRGALVAVEPHDTDWGTVSACLTGPHGVLVEVYERK
jgi:uncharacterized glyoxalase superfamily protein PhnB